jgi:hypothetical protein
MLRVDNVLQHHWQRRKSRGNRNTANFLNWHVQWSVPVSDGT